MSEWKNKIVTAFKVKRLLPACYLINLTSLISFRLFMWKVSVSGDDSILRPRANQRRVTDWRGMQESNRPEMTI